MDDFKTFIFNGPERLVPQLFKSADLQLERAEINLKSFTSLFISFLIIEVVILIPASIIVLTVYLKRLHDDRIRLFAAAVCVPKAIVVDLVQRKTRVGMDNEEVRLVCSLAPCMPFTCHSHGTWQNPHIVSLSQICSKIVLYRTTRTRARTICRNA